MRIRFKVDLIDKLVFGISISASMEEIQSMRDSLEEAWALYEFPPEDCDSLKHFYFALGVMIGKEDFEVKTENQDKD
jgi:hypothetical protein